MHVTSLNLPSQYVFRKFSKNPNRYRPRLHPYPPPLLSLLPSTHRDASEEMFREDK